MPLNRTDIIASTPAEMEAFLFSPTVQTAWSQSRFYNLQSSRPEANEPIISSHHRTVPVDELATMREALEKATATSKPLEILPKSTVVEDISYEDYYWKFVNATDSYTAQEALDSMLSCVSLDLQPRPDGKSWVEDQALVISVRERKFIAGNYKVLIMFVVWCVITFILGWVA